MLDFGGAAAGHYFTAKRIFGESLPLKWCVVETPAMVRACRQLESSELRFFSDRDAAAAELRVYGGITLAYSSGALMYVPDPRGWLNWFCELGAEHLALVRVGLHDGADDIIQIQASRLAHNGPGPLPPGISDCVVRYPLTLCSRPAVESLLTTRYHTELWTDEDEGWPVPQARTFGYYCRRSN